MEFINILKEKQVDIYISFFMTIFGLLFGIALDSLRKSTPTPDNHVSLTVTSTINFRRNYFNNQPGDNGLMIFIVPFMLVTGTIYLFFRTEILNVMYYLTLFIIFLWGGRIVYNMYVGRFIGWQWAMHLAFYCVFSAMCFLAVNKALSPNSHPEYFNYIQKIINKYGIFGLKDYFTYQDFKWFALHILGVIILFIAMLYTLLFSTYFSVMGNYVINAREQEPWLAKKTRKYAHKKNIVYVFFLVISSYCLVAGDFFRWVESDFPKIVEYLFNTAFYGR